jgi:hypothetical protein
MVEQLLHLADQVLHALEVGWLADGGAVLLALAFFALGSRLFLP